MPVFAEVEGEMIEETLFLTSQEAVYELESYFKKPTVAPYEIELDE